MEQKGLLLPKEKASLVPIHLFHIAAQAFQDISQIAVLNEILGGHGNEAPHIGIVIKYISSHKEVLVFKFKNPSFFLQQLKAGRAHELGHSLGSHPPIFHKGADIASLPGLFHGIGHIGVGIVDQGNRFLQQIVTAVNESLIAVGSQAELFQSLVVLIDCLKNIMNGIQEGRPAVSINTDYGTGKGCQKLTAAWRILLPVRGKDAQEDTASVRQGRKHRQRRKLWQAISCGAGGGPGQ
jgi:hypothetical protein